MSIALVSSGCGAADDDYPKDAQGRPQTLADVLPAPSEDSLRARHNHYQEDIQKCMRKIGLKYDPEEYPRIQVIGRQTQEFGPLKDELVAEYGYGISTNATKMQRIEDRYITYARSLSASDQESYLRKVSACQARAAKKHYAEIEHFSDEITGQIDAMNKDIAADNRVKPAIVAWRTCMADGGYQFESRSSIIALLKNRLDAARAGHDGGFDQEKLSSLQQLERKVANKDAECWKAHADNSYQPVRDEFERKFVKANWSTLKSLKEAYAHTA